MKPRLFLTSTHDFSVLDYPSFLLFSFFAYANFFVCFRRAGGQGCLADLCW
ncbi:expressed unknown protein [Ectocarpus siliculosus]|uniref:Uncharacterized protein n=1 Tax=Ectocarpus siliculosus TaxID=2880 RepID=D7G7D6_ECTSI|nr:expressed unknown protein [Ectocarpus siliculosus]|eukprot:CBJ27687.1 expressed unknown protein [Ectocarpus siliculosus]